MFFSYFCEGSEFCHSECIEICDVKYSTMTAIKFRKITENPFEKITFSSKLSCQFKNDIMINANQFRPAN